MYYLGLNGMPSHIIQLHRTFLYVLSRIKRYAESHYTAPPYVAALEKRGLQGDIILVEGIRTGSAKVSTRLKDPQYKVS